MIFCRGLFISSHRLKPYSPKNLNNRNKNNQLPSSIACPYLQVQGAKQLRQRNEIDAHEAEEDMTDAIAQARKKKKAKWRVSNRISNKAKNSGNGRKWKTLQTLILQGFFVRCHPDSNWRIKVLQNAVSIGITTRAVRQERSISNSYAMPIHFLCTTTYIVWTSAIFQIIAEMHFAQNSSILSYSVQNSKR